MLVESLKEISPNGKPRELLLRVAKVLDEGKKCCVLLRAPTGYGKTTLSLAIYKAIRDGWDGAVALTHVLPLRSIGDDLYLKAAEVFYRARPLGPSCMDIGVQHSFSPGSPILGRRFNIVTLDTFLMSLYKLPPFALNKIIGDRSMGQYEVPRGFILTSLIYFDEVHLYFQSERMSSLFLDALKFLSENKVPVVMASATVPDDLRDALVETYGENDCVVVEGKPSDAPQRCLELHVMSDDYAQLVETKLSEGKSVILVRNTVRQAIEDYKRLKHLNPVLIHGRLAEGERIRRVNELLADRNLKGRLVIATQVIEAGVDVSADVLITSPAPPESLEQRMGRVARYGGSGEVYLLKPTEEDFAVYGQEKVIDGFKQFEELAKQSCDDRKPFTYRIPISRHSDVSLVLSQIARLPFMTSRESVEVMRNVCNVVRDDELITVYPEELLKERCRKVNDHLECENLSEIVVPMNGSTLKNPNVKLKFLVAYSLGPSKEGRKVQYYIVEDNWDAGCFFNKTVRLSVGGTQDVKLQPLGIVVEGYDKEVGLVGK